MSGTRILRLTETQYSDRAMFSRLIGEVYAVTDFICEDYPNYIRNYFTKFVPGLFSKEREFFIALNGIGKVVGVCICKRTKDEQKICTLYVSDSYRGQGIGSKLVARALDWLGTDKPLITLSANKLPMFHGLIQKYGWTCTQQKDKSYYGGQHDELVFNGELK